MYLDILEADDKKQLTTKNRPNDKELVHEKEEEEEEAVNENAQMNTSISNVCVARMYRPCDFCEFN